MDENLAQRERSQGNLVEGDAKYYKKDFWSTENLKYEAPHFRMRKVARVVSRLAGSREWDLLDVGCGPGTLQRLMPPNVHYHGIDISIPVPADNLLEEDILQAPIDFRGLRFDVVVAQGMFEYVGEYQSQKFAEIASLLKRKGKFVLTYQNFDHRQREVYWPYSNVRRGADFRADLSRFFRIERSFPVSHNWHHSQPRRPLLQASQAHVNLSLPVISPMLAVDYLYVCAPVRSGPAGSTSPASVN
ncbi:MAG TPA: methyltransferase domain-containing protein [Trebonia sp.]|nr:methyltransferase domain-containing protein [Trebonia sp.]